MSTSEPPLGKHLASSDKKTRDKAMNGLVSFICHESNAHLSEKEMAKLWKGIFYCFWMSDKPLVQQALATDLANILLSIPTLEAALAFLRGFWETIVREWTGLDRLRLNKFYMLIRRFVNATFRLLMRESWNESTCNVVNDILSCSKGPLYPHDAKIPFSISNHLADIYLEELNKVLSELKEEDSPSPLPKVIEPFIILASEASNNAIVKRIQVGLIEPLLLSLLTASSSAHSPASEPGPVRKRPKVTGKADQSVDNKPEDSEVGIDIPLYFVARRSRGTSDANESSNVSSSKDVLEAVLKVIFDIASRDISRDSNRRKLYAVWKSTKEEMGDT